MSVKAVHRVVVSLLQDHTELFKQFRDNPCLKKWPSETIFSVTYKRPAASAPEKSAHGADCSCRLSR
jgi:type I restriction enzyme R subunit